MQLQIHSARIPDRDGLVLITVQLDREAEPVPRCTWLLYLVLFVAGAGVSLSQRSQKHCTSLIKARNTRFNYSTRRIYHFIQQKSNSHRPPVKFTEHDWTHKLKQWRYFGNACYKQFRYEAHNAKVDKLGAKERGPIIPTCSQETACYAQILVRLKKV